MTVRVLYGPARLGVATLGKTAAIIDCALSRAAWPRPWPSAGRRPSWRAMLVVLLRDTDGIVPPAPVRMDRGPVNIYEIKPRPETLGFKPITTVSKESGFH